jgi:hypothetical protein
VRRLKSAGARQVFREAASGAKTDRAQLRRLFARLDAGDMLMRGGVGPCVAERSEASTPAGDRREGVQEIARRSRQAIEARNNERRNG